MLGFIKRKLQRQQRSAFAKQCTNGRLKQLLNTQPPDSNLKIADTEFLVADLEMTGLDPKHDQIVSYGFTVIKQGGIQHALARHELVSLVDPDLTESAPIHRIFNNELVHGVDPQKALDDFLAQLENRVLVLHHAGLDSKFLDAACQKHHGARLSWPTVDTMQLEIKRRQQQGKELHQLDLANTRKRYGLPYYTQHNAAADALATAELLLAQLSCLDPDNQRPLSAIL